MRRVLAGLLSVATGALLGASCTSRSEELCELVCECEHCADWAEEARCAELEADLRIAEAYDCGSAWESWASCVEDEGECKEGSARYSTDAPGDCNVPFDIGLPCTTVADCEPLGVDYPQCLDGTCKQMQCADGSGACMTGEQCSGGGDLCEDERKALVDCELASSDHPAYILGSGSGEPGTAPGPSPGPAPSPSPAPGPGG